MMYPHRVVANDEISIRAESPIHLENNDGRAREVTGQIELSDDDEAFVFGEQVIRQMMQGSGRQYAGCATELYESGRIVGRTPLENYQKPLSPWQLGVATQ